MTITHEQLLDYLAQYAGTLTDLDATAAAELWSMPGVIADDDFTGVVESRDAMVQGLEQSYPIYQKLGLDSVGYELLEEKHLTDALVLARVRWEFFDAAGDLLTDSNAHYLIRAEESGLRACVCVPTDDAEKLQTLAAARGIDLTPPSN